MKRELSPFWTLFILTGLNLFNYLDRFVLSVVLPPLRQELHLDHDQAGTIGTAFMLGYFLTAPLFGYLGDRASRKWLIAGGIFVWSLGTVLTGFAQSYGELLFYRVLVGVGEASYATISPGIIADKFSGRNATRPSPFFTWQFQLVRRSGMLWEARSLRTRHGGKRSSGRCAGLLLAVVMLPFADPRRADVPKHQSPAHVT